LADGIVDQLTVLPHAIEQYEDFGGVYGIRLHFGNDLDAGCGVLEVAALADADVLRDPVASGVWVETHATIEGVNVIARALLTKDAVDALDDDPVPDTDTVPEEPAIPPPPAAEPVPLYATVLPVVPITAAIADGAK
jgi:hypothetical protein